MAARAGRLSSRMNSEIEIMQMSNGRIISLMAAL